MTKFLNRFRCKWPGCAFMSILHSSVTGHVRIAHLHGQTTLDPNDYVINCYLEFNKPTLTQPADVRRNIVSVDTARPSPPKKPKLDIPFILKKSAQPSKFEDNWKKTNDIPCTVYVDDCNVIYWPNDENPTIPEKAVKLRILSLQCPMDCPDTFYHNTNEIIMHMYEKHMMLPYRCLDPGCNRSFGSKYGFSFFIP